MKHLFEPGDLQVYEREVLPEDAAAFHGAQVHPVCATFALARDIEYASRLFVLAMREEGEEGIGTYLTIHHQSPALVGQTVRIEARVKSLHKNELICSYQVLVGKRVVATGETGQKVLPRHRLQAVFDKAYVNQEE